MVKTCARCGKLFIDGDAAFITCPKCRRPLPEGSEYGGCTRWENIAKDPRSNSVVHVVDYRPGYRRTYSARDE